MSKLSFKSFCIEFYARHAHVDGPTVYRIFTRSGLMKMLDDDYDDLHGMSWESLMPLFDQYLGKTTLSANQQSNRLLFKRSVEISQIQIVIHKASAMSENHALIRATLVSQVVAILAKYYKLDANFALAKFYDSKTALALADDETGLYGQSALNIACQCIAEYDKTVEISRL